MLQRVQSVYLFLVFLFAVLFAVLPLGHFPVGSPDMPLRLISMHDFFASIDGTGIGWMGALLILFWAIAILITVYMTFQYRKRLFQIKLGKMNIMVHAVMILITFFFLDSIRNQLDDTGFSYGAAVFFPVISLIFILLANKAIRKDEELVRSADRLR
ncbi:MAG: DUF4293 domain-containing protein [Bacteroidales bacterium]